MTLQKKTPLELIVAPVVREDDVNASLISRLWDDALTSATVTRRQQVSATRPASRPQPSERRVRYGLD